MKTIKLLILLFCTALSATAQHTSHWKEYYPGGYWLSGLSGDTIHMNKGVYTYISGENCNNITFIPDEGTEMRNGFNFINSSNIHFAGYDSITGKHKLFIHDATGVGIQGAGKCSNWLIDGIDQNNVYSWLWFKTDPDQFHIKGKDGKDSLDNTGHVILDTTGWHYLMDFITVKNCNWKKANFDGIYIGNTDPQGKRTYWVNGKWINVIPDPVGHVLLENLFCDTAYRTTCQVSGLKDSLTVKNCSFLNAGINSFKDADAKNQGYNFIIGGANNSIYASINNSVFKNSNLANVRTQAGGTIIFNNNVTDSATSVFRIGQGYEIGSQTMASVEFDNPVPTLINFQNNNIGWSNNNIGFVNYGLMQSGSVYANNTLSGLMQNKTTTDFITTVIDTIPKDTVVTTPPVDTPIITKPKNGNLIDSVTIIFHRVDGSIYTPVNWKKININQNFNYSITYYDSTKEVLKSKNAVYPKKNKVDSTQVSDTTTVGIMPFKVANEYDVATTRDVFQVEGLNAPAYIKNISERLSGYDTLLLNINHADSTFTDNPKLYADSFKQAAAYAPNAIYYVDENEEMLHQQSIEKYCEQLKVTTASIPDKVCNGGFTLSLFYWYYAQTHDTDFALKCLPTTRINYQSQRVTDQQYELDVMKDLNMVANVHYYLKDTNQVQPIIRMLKYVKHYLGLEMISNEAGIYTQDPALIKGLVTIARELKMKYLIMYCSVGNPGRGLNQCLPISKNDFETALK